jgi:hypothetical protein
MVEIDSHECYLSVACHCLCPSGGFESSTVSLLTMYFRYAPPRFAAIASPKFTSTFGPFYKTEFFLGAGLGCHSNDARGVTATQVAGDPTTLQSTRPFLARMAGAEIGARTKIVPGLDSSISLF